MCLECLWGTFLFPISATPRKLTRIHQVFGVFLHPMTPTLIVSNLIPDKHLREQQIIKNFWGTSTSLMINNFFFSSLLNMPLRILYLYAPLYVPPPTAAVNISTTTHSFCCYSKVCPHTLKFVSSTWLVCIAKVSNLSIFCGPYRRLVFIARGQKHSFGHMKG